MYEYLEQNKIQKICSRCKSRWERIDNENFNLLLFKYEKKRGYLISIARAKQIQIKFQL